MFLSPSRIQVALLFKRHVISLIWRIFFFFNSRAWICSLTSTDGERVAIKLCRGLRASSISVNSCFRLAFFFRSHLLTTSFRFRSLFRNLSVGVRPSALSFSSSQCNWTRESKPMSSSQTLLNLKWKTNSYINIAPKESDWPMV